MKSPDSGSFSRSGTTKIYQQLLERKETVIAGAPAKSLCEGRPGAWCQKELGWGKGWESSFPLFDLVGGDWLP